MAGKTLEVLVDGIASSEKCRLQARTRFQAPEVDGLTYVHGHSGRLKIGMFTNAKIVDTLEYDLVGESV